MNTISKTITVDSHSVTIAVNPDTYVTTITVDGKDVLGEPLKLKDTTPSGITEALKEFSDDHAKGAIVTMLQNEFFEQPMKCKKSFDCLGGIINVAMVAHSDTSTECGCVVSRLTEEDEWVVTEQRVLELQEGADVLQMLETFTQPIADEIAICYMVSGNLPFE